MVSFAELQNLLDKRNDCGFEGFVVQAVLSVKTLGVAVVFLEEVIAVDCGIVHAEQTIGILAIKIGYALELLTFHHVKVLYNLACNLKGFGSVLASVLERICGVSLHDLGHCGHVERRIHAYLFVSEHLLGIHGAH